MKDNNSKTISSGGIGFAGLLTIVLITLKLLGVIDWAWIWVISPLWISALVSFAILTVVLLVVWYFCGGDDSLWD